MQDKKVREIIEWIDTAELYKMLRDLETGGIHLKRLIKQKLDERDLSHMEICANCSAQIDRHNTNTYTLIFGPDDFRKKATFCGLDCMETFLNSLKQIKRG